MALIDYNLINAVLIDYNCISVVLIDYRCINVALIDYNLINVALINNNLLNAVLIDYRWINESLIDYSLISAALIDFMCINATLIDYNLINAVFQHVKVPTPLLGNYTFSWLPAHTERQSWYHQSTPHMFCFQIDRTCPNMLILRKKCIPSMPRRYLNVQLVRIKRCSVSQK